MRVIVLGGGLMGSAVTFFLAQRGIDVQLIERGFIGAGATVASFGNIRRSGRHLSQLPLALRSLDLWNRAETLLDQDVEFRATGHLRLVFDTASLEDMTRYATAAAGCGLQLEILSPAEVRARFPGLGPSAIAASFSPLDGSANPRLVSPAFARAARRAGAIIQQQAGKVQIARTATGFEVTSRHGRAESDILVNCAGAWGAQISQQFDEPVPLSPHGPQMGVTEPLPHRIHPVVGMWSQTPGAYFRQVERGNIVFGGGVARVPVDPETGFAKADISRLTSQLAALLPLCPALQDVALIRQWSGCEGYIEDGLPVIGASATTPGLYHAFGFCGHGFQLGPGVGEAMAELIATGSCATPLDDFAIKRFAA